jgi:hypothetical protein
MTLPIATAEQVAARDGVSDRLASVLSSAVLLVDRLHTTCHKSDRAALESLRERIEALAPESAEPALRGFFVPRAAWGLAVRARLGECPEVEGLSALLLHLGSPSTITLSSGRVVESSMPSSSWSKTARDLLLATPDGIRLVRIMLEELATIEEQRTESFLSGKPECRRGTYIDGSNVELARGALWAAAEVDEPWVEPLVADVALRAATSRRQGYGRCEPIARIVVATLSRERTPASRSVLRRLEREAQSRDLRVLAGEEAIENSTLRDLIKAVHELNVEEPELDHEIYDDDGQTIARAEAVWEDDLLGMPTAFLLEPDAEMSARLASLGYRVYTDFSELHELLEEVAEGNDDYAEDERVYDDDGFPVDQ